MSLSINVNEFFSSFVTKTLSFFFFVLVYTYNTDGEEDDEKRHDELPRRW